MKQTYVRWSVDSADLIDLTPVKARDLVTRCLLEAHKETFAYREELLGHDSAKTNLHALIEGAVRLAFREAKEDYENPSATSLMKVVQILTRKSTNWGTPLEVIEHHKRQITLVIQCFASCQPVR